MSEKDFKNKQSSEAKDKDFVDAIANENELTQNLEGNLATPDAHPLEEVEKVVAAKIVAEQAEEDAKPLADEMSEEVKSEQVKIDEIGTEEILTEEGKTEEPIKEEVSSQEQSTHEVKADERVSQEVKAVGKKNKRSKKQEDAVASDAKADETIAVEQVDVSEKKDKKSKKNKSDVSNSLDGKDEKFITEKTERDKNKSDAKKKRIMTIAISVLAVIVILVICITVPIVVVNKGKIFVSAAEDFQKIDKGNIFVLNKNIVVEGDLVLGAAYSIDLNKHSLTVKGNLVYDFADAAENTVINFGSRKGKNWVVGGTMDVQGDININVPKANVAIYGAVGAQNYNIKATKFMSATSFRATQSVTIDASEMSFNDKIVFNEVGSVNLANGKATVKASLNAVISLENASLDALSGTELNTVKVDANSVFTTEGRVTGKVTNRIEGEQGNEVYFKEGSSCVLVENIDTVRIYVADSNIAAIENYKNIIYMEKLNTPLNVNIVDEGGTLYCVVAAVNNAAFYEYTIDGEVFATVTENRIDVTAKISTAGGHHISVVAKGAPDSRFIDSSAVEIQYNYEVKLATPHNIVIEHSAEGKVVVKFPTIAFADSYDITVNGVTKEFVKDATLGTQSFEITDMTRGVGEYSVNIVAKSYNTIGFKNSNAGAASFIIGGKLDAPVVVGTEEGDAFILRWEGISNAKYYTVYAKVGNDVKVVKTIVSNSISLAKADIANGTVFYVVADGSGFYTSSDASVEVVFTLPAVVTE